MRPAVVAVALALAGCVSVEWRRETRFAPPRAAAIAALVPGETTVAEVLAALGAPFHVWEYKEDGVALAYGSSRQRDLGLTVSVPVFERTSARLDYDDVHERLRGVVLTFGPDWRLEQVREGYLRDLERAYGRRPAPVPDAPAGAPAEPGGGGAP